MADDLTPMASTAEPACPTCSKPVVEAHRPFCSDRCRDVDLNRWLTGAYAIPAVEEPDPDEEIADNVIRLDEA